jgi:hypothetical protein
VGVGGDREAAGLARQRPEQARVEIIERAVVAEPMHRPDPGGPSARIRRAYPLDGLAEQGRAAHHADRAEKWSRR